MTYSVQQIKFELISYVKEFGGDFREWSVGIADDAPKALFELNKVDPVSDVWLWKPAASASGAAMVHAWMTERQHANAVAGDSASGASVFMFKKTPKTPPL
ncbi:MAG: hypothetical protein WDN46_07285 [Methylocella sp.]